MDIRSSPDPIHNDSNGHTLNPRYFSMKLRTISGLCAGSQSGVSTNADSVHVGIRAADNSRSRNMLSSLGSHFLDSAFAENVATLMFSLSSLLGMEWAFCFVT